MILLARDTLDALVFDWLGQDRGHAPVLDLAETVARDAFLPHFKAADQHPAHLDAGGRVVTHPDMARAMAAYREAGLFALSLPESDGGPGLPLPISTAAGLFFAAANPATAGLPMLTAGNARLLTRYGTAQQIRDFAKPQIDGRWFGTMCLSEPQAGSSLAEITTRAVDRGDGTYAVMGNKMWISGGDQDISKNIVHLVLAKIDEALSLLIVPKFLADGTRNDVQVAGVNHKMGYRGLPNCLLNFGEGGGATGYLVGQVGQGLKIMFMMMNEARLAVGAGAAAIAARGCALAHDYAAQRMHIGVPIDQHPDVQRMLMAQHAYSVGALALVLWTAKLADDDSLLLDLITPIAKAWPSEFGVRANDLAIQVHGGYGYTQDFDVEQLYRDQRLNPIHEGTNGIQAQDLFIRKIIKDRGQMFAALMAEIADQSPALQPWHDRVMRAMTPLLPQATEDPKIALACATPVQFALSHLLVAHLWQSLAHTSPAFGDGCKYFMDWELPQIGPVLDRVQRL